MSYLQERYDYLKKNGFQAYGAVVTGPTKELLKLRISNQKLVMLGFEIRITGNKGVVSDFFEAAPNFR